MGSNDSWNLRRVTSDSVLVETIFWTCDASVFVFDVRVRMFLEELVGEDRASLGWVQGLVYLLFGFCVKI